jgi:LmbE family N-acetylglucosaminyl deacetylase
MPLISTWKVFGFCGRTEYRNRKMEVKRTSMPNRASDVNGGDVNGGDVNGKNVNENEQEKQAGKNRLLCILAHPDDESMGTGGILAKYAAEGVATYVITATRGHYGWSGAPTDNPGPESLARLREEEGRAATAVLGVEELTFLDYIDGELDQAEPEEVIAELVAHVRRIRPHVVVTFAPDGAYGHPDHIAISQLTSAALVRAADSAYLPDVDMPDVDTPHATPKLYYYVNAQPETELFCANLGELSMEVDGLPRGMVTWPDWAITTRIDVREYLPRVHAAIACHDSQIQGDFQRIMNLPLETLAEGIGFQTFYRVYSLVNGGRAIEDDLFAGIG